MARPPAGNGAGEGPLLDGSRARADHCGVAFGAAAGLIEAKEAPVLLRLAVLVAAESVLVVLLAMQVFAEAAPVGPPAAPGDRTNVAPTAPPAGAAPANAPAPAPAGTEAATTPART